MRECGTHLLFSSFRDHRRHNLGLLHANENGNYLDYTSYMSAGSTVERYPQKCFNGQNHWHFGWFADRTLTLRNVDTPVVVRLSSFVDYRLLSESDDVVLVSIDDEYFIQFNQAKDHNIETQEKANAATIVQRRKGGTEMLAGIDENSPVYRIPEYEGKSILAIAFCGREYGERGAGETMVISIGRNTVACPISPTPPPSKYPSSFPSLAPSESRPSVLPSETPSSAPTRSPSAVPSTSPSERPTTVPSREATPVPQPSTSPSSLPSLAPTNTGSIEATETVADKLSSSLPAPLSSNSPSSRNPYSSDRPSTVPTLSGSPYSDDPTNSPSFTPSIAPTEGRSEKPSNVPSALESDSISTSPSDNPDDSSSSFVLPIVEPSAGPSRVPLASPSLFPSKLSSVAPSDAPSTAPSQRPSVSPSFTPSMLPSAAPSLSTSSHPSNLPTISTSPTDFPTLVALIRRPDADDEELAIKLLGDMSDPGDSRTDSNGDSNSGVLLTNSGGRDSTAVGVTGRDELPSNAQKAKNEVSEETGVTDSAPESVEVEKANVFRKRQVHPARASLLPKSSDPNGESQLFVNTFEHRRGAS